MARQKRKKNPVFVAFGWFFVPHFVFSWALHYWDICKSVAGVPAGREELLARILFWPLVGFANSRASFYLLLVLNSVLWACVCALVVAAWRRLLAAGERTGPGREE